jgi:hypothetical protein
MKMATTNAVGGVERRFRKEIEVDNRLEIVFAPGQEESRSIGYRDGSAVYAGFTWTLAEMESGNGYVETFSHIPAAQPEEESPPLTSDVEREDPLVTNGWSGLRRDNVNLTKSLNAYIDQGVIDRAEIARLKVELNLYRTFRAEALAAHAHASPSLVEIEFGRADDRLRAGLAKA